LAYGLIVTEVDLATQVLEKFSGLQAVHHWAFDLAQVKSHPGIAEPSVNRLEALQSARIDVVDGRTLQHHLLRIGVLGHQIIDSIFKSPGASKVKAFIHAQAHKPGTGGHVMPQHVPKMFSAWYKPNLRNMRLAGAVQKEGQ
jgi:hypothetical protein